MNINLPDPLVLFCLCAALAVVLALVFTALARWRAQREINREDDAL